jgi:hypothetical protein
MRVLLPTARILFAVTLSWALLAPAVAATLAATPEGGAVFVGAGDIASCFNSDDEATATLLDGIDGTVFTLGDNAYDHGSEGEFVSCYEPTWGRHKDRTRPTPGNHDYQTEGADGYFDYFGESAGTPGEGWYSYELGGWHIVALNTNCDHIGGCSAGSSQMAWLEADLAANDARCTLAYMHHPRFSSAGHGNEADLDAIWSALHADGAELVLAGHDHTYERFAPVDPEGNPDPEAGIVQIVVGTGGASLRGFGEVHPASESRSDDAHGVLRLDLRPDGYGWQFIPVEGDTFTDAGEAGCH